MKVRDEGYSHYPNTGIDKDEGYSPSLGSVSIPCDQNSLFAFNPSLDPESFLSRLCIFRSSPLPTPTFPFLPSLARLRVARILSPWSGPKSFRWVVCPIPSLTLEEAFPATNLTEIHWVRGLLWSCEIKNQHNTGLVEVNATLMGPLHYLSIRNCGLS